MPQPQYETYNYGDKVYYRQPGVAGLKQFQNPEEIQNFASKGLIDERNKPRQTLSSDPSAPATPPSETNSDLNLFTPREPGSDYNSIENILDSLNTERYQRDTKPVNEAELRSQAMQEVQSQLDAIDLMYNNLIAQERVAGEGRAGSTRAIVSRSGTLGSPIGEAARERTTQYNLSQQKSLESQRATLKTGILSGAMKRANDRIMLEKEKANLAEKDYIDWLEGLKTSTRNDITKLASTGVGLDELSEDEYVALLENSGFSPLEFKANWFANSPAEKKPEYDMVNMGDGRVLFYYTDPTTGKLITEEHRSAPPDESPDWKLKQFSDGTVVWYNSATKQMEEMGNYAKPKAPKPKDPEILPYLEAIQEIESMPTVNQSVPGQSQYGMTDEQKKEAIKNIRLQAAQEFKGKSATYDEFIKVLGGDEKDRTFDIKVTPEGYYDVDKGRLLTEQEAADYVTNKNKISIF